MALGFDESKKQFGEFLEAARAAKTTIEGYGYTVAVEDDIELAAKYIIQLSGRTIAVVSWNAPYYLDFTSSVRQKENSFSVDYIKNIKDWRCFWEDICTSLYEYVDSSK